MRKIHYSEYPVPDSLKRHIKCAWNLRGEAESGQIDTIYPDGCCEIILHRGTPPKTLQANGVWQRQKRNLFAAQHRSAIRLAPERHMDCIGIRLQAAASAALCTMPLVSLRDQVVDLCEFNRAFAERLAALVSGRKKLAVLTSLVENADRRNWFVSDTSGY
ncbi:MAG: DUF6597 domain-containing transcriptional factor [Xanthomonadales bacterium]|nr:DUF6597 domain-containing transcriptional factor [Xanthomonadales bacterium]